MTTGNLFCPSHRNCVSTAGQWLTQGIEVRHRPIQPNEFQQAFHKPSGLPNRQTEQNFDREAGLYGRIGIGLLSSPFIRRQRIPRHLAINQIDKDPRGFSARL
jgi:hypothetical protein